MIGDLITSIIDEKSPLINVVWCVSQNIYGYLVYLFSSKANEDLDNFEEKKLELEKTPPRPPDEIPTFSKNLKWEALLTTSS